MDNPFYIPEGSFPVEIAPGIHMLGNYYFNLFLIQGKERSALFETGVSGVVDQVIGQLDQMAIVPDHIIVSHPHSDHITGLPGLKERFPDAQVMAGQGAEAFITHPKAGPALIKEDRFISQRLESLGIAPGRPSLETIPDLSGHTEVFEPTRLDLGSGSDLVLLPVQGHSPGNLIAWAEAQGVLFCSDSLGFHYPGRGFWPLFFTGAAGYMETLDQITALSPRIICPAHQGPITGNAVPRALSEAKAAAREMIARACSTGLSDEDLSQELFEESYKDEFTLYTPENISNCNRLLIKRARES